MAEKEAEFRRQLDEKKLVPHIHVVQPGDECWEKDRERTEEERYEDRCWQRQFGEKWLREEETDEQEMVKEEDVWMEEQMNRRDYAHFLGKQDRRQRRCAIWRRRNSRGATKGRLELGAGQDD
jgi:hypothetical protein